MKGLWTVRILMAAACLALGASNVSAQVFGTFTWQMQPYCNNVTLTLTSVTGNFTLDGSDDQCGAAKKGSATGIGVFNPDGSIGLNFTIVEPSGHVVAVAANVSPANGQGTWTDDADNSGTFAFFGATPGLPVRPTGRVFFRATAHQTGALTSGTVLWSGITHNVGGGTYNAATGVYTVPSAGVYSVTYSVSWITTTATPGRVCGFVRAGAVLDRSSCVHHVAANLFVSPSGATHLSLAAGDTIRVTTSRSSGDPELASNGEGVTIFKLR